MSPSNACSPKPSYNCDVTKIAANTPQSMLGLTHWVLWRYEHREGKWTKVPYQANGKPAKSNDEKTWNSFEVVRTVLDPLSENYNDSFDGAGFMLHDSPFVGLDFDGVVDDGVPEPYVLNILSQLGDPYREITPSGDGLRCFVECAALPAPGRKFPAQKEGVEKYGAEIYVGNEGGRYLTSTGEKFGGEGIPQVTPEQIAVGHFLVSKFADQKFRRMWMGDASDHQHDDSRLDIALLGKLYRTLGDDMDKALRFFDASVPGHRPKWREREDYRTRTVNKILSDTKTRPPQQNHDYWTEPCEPKKNLTLDMVPLSKVKAAIQRWLWENRIPMDALSNISGVADQGKSQVLYDIIARISTGADFPDGTKNPFGEPKKILLFFSEGSLETTVKPRLMVMHANMENIIAVKSVKVNPSDDADKRQFRLDSDLDVLRKALASDPNIVMVAFDTITSYVGDECNINLPQDVRDVLTPLGEIAEQQHVTVVSIVHFSKNTLAEAIHRTGGASTWVDFPRAAWCCSVDKASEDRNTFVFSRIKSNLGKRIGGLTYRIEETFLDIDGVQTSQPKLVWGSGVNRGADEVLDVQKAQDKSDIDAAKEWLESTFSDDDARPTKNTKAAALHEGISDDGFDRARLRLRMQKKFLNGRWWMRRNQDKNNPWCECPEESLSLDLPSEEEITL